MLSTSVKPGAMPFSVNYTLQKPSPLRSSSIGYTLGGSFKVDVTLGNGRKKDMPEFYFTINERSRIARDSEAIGLNYTIPIKKWPTVRFYRESVFSEESKRNNIIINFDIFLLFFRNF